MSLTPNGNVPRVFGSAVGTQGIHDVTTKAEWPVGTRGELPDGRVFYYSKSGTGAALNVGQLYVRKEIATNHENCAVGAATSGTAGSFVVSAITIGATALTENQYRDGYLVVTDGAGEGYVYVIESHAAFDASASTVSVRLYTPIVVSLTATSTVSFVSNQYDTPQIANTDQADVLVGVPAATITQSTSALTYYGWIQTWGLAAVWCDEAVGGVGQALTIGTGTAGQVEEDDTATTVSQEPLVGYNVTPLVDTEYQAVFLTISR
jgi:hypothetical protein